MTGKTSKTGETTSGLLLHCAIVVKTLLIYKLKETLSGPRGDEEMKFSTLDRHL